MTGRADYQPLYAQVKSLLIQRIGSGAWKPGEMLPNEFALAAEYNVSQGTVRKALLAMEADRLIVRRQGRGTYVSRHTRQETLFHFFRMVGLDDRRRLPASVVLSHRIQPATRQQAAALAVELGAALHAVVRVRSFDGKPSIFERIFVPVALMPALSVEIGVDMAEEMYVIYQERYGITIARATERLAAVAAKADDAKHL
ncbi:MAG TPA: GntR family transcriptional regulator, partial [Acidisphaera sp.]|nr:GntR family transcriptional regulator [Acidisphaera sp.]